MHCSTFQDTDNAFLNKKRKFNIEDEHKRESLQQCDVNQNAVSVGEWFNGYNNCQIGKTAREHSNDRKFIHLCKKDNESIYQTEEWQASEASIFFPLTEDIMVNTRNIEQFSCTQGNFSIAGPDGYYSQTVQGYVLHLWRYCSLRNKIFISRSFLFKSYQDFYEVQQALQKL